MKKYGFYLSCIAIIFAILFCFGGSFQKISAASAVLSQKGTVLIDPGHGGEDGGAVGIGGVMEKDINLPVSLLLRDLFMNNGYRVIMTRDTDCDLGNKDLTTVRERKRSDIKKRVEIINSSGADLVLSLHQNHFQESKYNGAQIFYVANESKPLAESLQRAIVEKLQPDNKREAKVSDSIYLLNNSKLPAVIVECGFISNPGETELLLKDDYQQQLAEAIYAGACNYLEAEKAKQ